MGKSNVHRLSRRDLLKLTGGVVVGSVAGLRTTPAFGQYSLEQCKPPAMEPAACAGGDVIEVFPTSPLIGGYVENGVVKGSAFRDRLPIPAPLAPVPRSIVDTWKNPPDRYKQDSHGLSTHQIWPSPQPAGPSHLPGQIGGVTARLHLVEGVAHRRKRS